MNGCVFNQIKQKESHLDMAYIPKKHRKYGLLPQKSNGEGEVFEYPSALVDEISRLIECGRELIPYGYKSYGEYYFFIEQLIIDNADNTIAVEKLQNLFDRVKSLNRKDEWSVLKYVGEPMAFGLTTGRCYYWPTEKSNPIYRGVIDDEEFTSYIYTIDADKWEILEDPTGMAEHTLK